MCNFYCCTTLPAVTLKVTVDQYECLKLGGSYGRSEEFKRSDAGTQHPGIGNTKIKVFVTAKKQVQ